MTEPAPAAMPRAAEQAYGDERKYVMPAEWEPHDATWIAWPHHEPDWPGKLGAIPWVYAEIVRILASHEQVEVLCHDEGVLDNARTVVDAHGAATSRVRCHVV